MRRASVFVLLLTVCAPSFVSVGSSRRHRHSSGDLLDELAVFWGL